MSSKETNSELRGTRRKSGEYSSSLLWSSPILEFVLLHIVCLYKVSKHTKYDVLVYRNIDEGVSAHSGCCDRLDFFASFFHQGKNEERKFFVLRIVDSYASKLY